MVKGTPSPLSIALAMPLSRGVWKRVYLLPLILHWTPLKADVLELELPQHRLYFPEGATDFALEVTRAIGLLEPMATRYGYLPGRKTIWVLRPDRLSFNGIAFHPWHRIELWGTVSFFELRGFTPWVTNVVLHEFAHLSTLPLANRFTSRIGGILLGGEGRIRRLKGNLGILYLYPAESVPRWFSEGIAQYEAELLGGDHWDTRRRSLERMRFLAGKMLSLEEMATLEEKGYLNGEAVYNQGYSFVRFLGERYGKEKLKKVLEDQADHPFRTFLGSLEEVYDKPISTLTAEWHASIRQRIEEDLNTLKLHEEGATIPSPPYVVEVRASPRGDLWAMISEKDGNDPEGRLVLAPKDDPLKEKVIATEALDPPQWTSDGTRLYFLQYGQRLGEERIQLIEYDTEHDTLTPLRKEEKVRYPALHPGGATLYAGRIGMGAINLVALSLTQPVLEELTDLPWGWEIRELNFSPQGVLYGILVHGDEIDLFRIPDLRNPRTIELLLWPRSEEHSPTVDSQGRLWFVSDAGGTFQLYSLSEAGVQVHTGAWGGVLGVTTLPDGALLLRVEKHERIELRRYPSDLSAPSGLPVTLPYSFQPFELPVRITEPVPFPIKPARFRLLPPLFYPEFLYQGREFTAGALALFGDELGNHELELEGLVGRFFGIHGRYFYSGSNPWMAVEFDHYRWLLPVSLAPTLPPLPVPIEYQEVQGTSLLRVVPGLGVGLELRGNRYRGEFVTEESEFLRGVEASLFTQVFEVPPNPWFELDFRGVKGYLSATLRRSSVVANGGGMVKVFYPRLYGSLVYAREVLGFTLEGRIFWGWIFKDVPPLEEFYLGGEIFLIRRGVFQTFAQMPGYPEFFLHGEKLLLLRPAIRRVFPTGRAHLGPFTLTALASELSLDFGNTYAAHQGWGKVLASLFRSPEATPHGSRGLFADIAGDLRIRWLLYDAYSWVTFLRLAYGFQDPEKRQGSFPFRIHLGLGAEIP